MKIIEVEQAVGITKKNIRFYEQEGLLAPSRAANGYRDYSEGDVNILRQIKLLRKLEIPLDEIRRLQSGALTLGDCLHRHLIVLARRRKNLEDVEGFCSRILTTDSSLATLPVEQLLAEMEEMEKGGTKFMDIRKKDKRKRKLRAAVAAGCVVLFMAWILALTVWALVQESETPILFGIFVAAIPLVVIIGTMLALIERFREIEGGEIDEASKY